MAELDQLETWCEAMLAKLTPAAQRRLLLDIARELRATNAGRIKAQTGPDGVAWPRRKPQGEGLRNQARAQAMRKKSGRPMFDKLRRPAWLKAKAQGGSAVVEFAGKAARLAQVHHFGLTDEVTPGGPEYKYPVRELLGIAPADADKLRDTILRHLHP